MECFIFIKLHSLMNKYNLKHIKNTFHPKIKFFGKNTSQTTVYRKIFLQNCWLVKCWLSQSLEKEIIFLFFEILWPIQ